MAWASKFWHIVLINGLLQIVTQSSATIGVANESPEAIEDSHTRICRIKDESEFAYRRIVNICRQLGTDTSGERRGK